MEQNWEEEKEEGEPVFVFGGWGSLSWFPCGLGKSQWFLDGVRMAVRCLKMSGRSCMLLKGMEMCFGSTCLRVVFCDIWRLFVAEVLSEMSCMRRFLSSKDGKLF